MASRPLGHVIWYITFFVYDKFFKLYLKLKSYIFTKLDFFLGLVRHANYFRTKNLHTYYAEIEREQGSFSSKSQCLTDPMVVNLHLSAG